MATCIFCRRSTSREPGEHILPEGLVGDIEFNAIGSRGPLTDRLVLADDEVCANCNHKRTSRLDEHLQKQLEFFKPLWNAKGSKRGRPAVANLPGLYARATPEGPRLTFNVGPTPVTLPEGVTIPAPRGQRNAVSVSGLQLGPTEGRFKASIRIRWSKTLVRALHKIAFELLCKQEGPDLVLQKRFDPLREYIRASTGVRWVATRVGAADSNVLSRPLLRLTRLGGTEDWLAELQLGVRFLLDLTPGSVVFHSLTPAAAEAHGFLVYPDLPGAQAVAI